MDLSKQYAIDQNGRLVYTSTYGGKTNNYIVWGIGENGLLHGVGSYVKRDDFIDKGYGFIIINEPTYEEIENYYKQLDKFNRQIGDED